MDAFDKIKSRLQQIGSQTGTIHLFENLDRVLGSFNQKNEIELKPNELDYKEVNRRFGDSFIKKYFPELRKLIPEIDVEHSQEGREQLINAIVSLKEFYLEDNDNEFSLRPICYSIQFGRENLRTETNKYGLIAGTETKGNIVESKYWTSDTKYENPGRLKSDLKGNPIGIGTSSEGKVTNFYYFIVTFQRSYDY